MNINYFNLPFGAQLLLWTTRVLINGSCRSFPNKYQLVNIAYAKVGVVDGDIILKKFLKILKEKNTFSIQCMNIQFLNITEINVINCIEDYKDRKFVGNYYLERWDIKYKKNDFICAAKELAYSFKKSNLNTNLNLAYKNNNMSQKHSFIYKTLH